MREVFRAIREFVRKADMVLLALCIGASIFGVTIIASATNYQGSSRYIRVQLLAMLMGVLCYIILTLIDIDIIAERREILFVLCVIFIAMLYFWGDEQYGNKSWLSFSWLPFNIQPAEICKIPFIIILAKIMSVKQNRISHPLTVLHIGGVTAALFAIIIFFSKDLGVALQYLMIFVIMAFVGGVSIVWFLGGLVAVVAAAPLVFPRLDAYQQNRILMIFDPSIDPNATGVRWQTNRSLRMLQSGGLAGRGLFRGPLVQSGFNSQQHNDFIFSSVGEELGMLGCLAVLLVLCLIVFRIVFVGIRSGNYMNRLICVGIGGMLASQTVVNVGMCVGLFPVVGLTLPFFSYGGSSIVTMFLAMGIVSGIYMRPAPDANARYIRPKL